MACNKSSKLNSMFLAALLLMLTLITSTIVSASPIKGLINRVTQPDCRPTYGNPIYSDCQTALELIPHDQNPDPRFATPLWFVNRHPMDTDVLMSSPLRYAYGGFAPTHPLFGATQTGVYRRIADFVQVAAPSSWSSYTTKMITRPGTISPR